MNISEILSQAQIGTRVLIIASVVVVETLTRKPTRNRRASHK